MMRVDVHLSLRQRLRMTASLLPADDTPGAPGVAPEVSTAPRLPKYYQVKRQLLELTAALDPGSPVPPERELARLYGTSRTTVRQALAELAVEGRLLRMQRQGNFVSKAQAAQGHLRRQAEGGAVPRARQLHRGHAAARPAPADQDPRNRLRRLGRPARRAARHPARWPRAAHPPAAARRRRAHVHRHLAPPRAP